MWGAYGRGSDIVRFWGWARHGRSCWTSNPVSPAPSIPDLLLAATAELSGLTVLHFDKDFDLIAAITGQPCERVTT